MRLRDLLPPPWLRPLPVVRRPWLRGGVALRPPSAQPLASPQAGAVLAHPGMLPPV